MIGVFIPKEMPQKCYECFYEHDCELVNPYYVEEQRPTNCPLISVELDDVPNREETENYILRRSDMANHIVEVWFECSPRMTDYKLFADVEKIELFSEGDVTILSLIRENQKNSSFPLNRVIRYQITDV